MAHEATIVVFVAQIVALLIAGRVMGELMQRIGQPPVIGQIIAGVLLGPSVFGALAPGLWHALFPAGAEQKAMLDAIAQLGILLLLMLTGMETDLSVFRDARRPALSISFTGIIVPFICGLVLGELLPDAMLPDPAKRIITTLFLGTALSISSVKIVALVVRDLGFVRRTVGQVIIASAILDDTIGWLIIAVILGLTLRGAIDVTAVTTSVIGTIVFLAVSFTVGRRLIFKIMRWANDNLRSEMSNVTILIVVTGLMALLTDAIGVHLVLGAFVAGVLIGQSPMLTSRVETQLRGLIVGLFMPVFFALAGLSTDLAALGRREFLLLTAGLILLASVGKFLGAFLGGRIGGLTYAESFAVGCGMNARGSTEIIVASIGLSMGALNERLYTAIVAMAVVTTMVMPPMLRWALARLPLGGEERERIEREEHEERAFLTHVERLLVAVDASPSGQFASHLVGLLAGVRSIPATVLHLEGESSGASADSRPARRSSAVAEAGADAGERAASPGEERIDITTRSQRTQDPETAIAAEARKGYGLLFIGREPVAQGADFDAGVTRSAEGFAGPFAITVARGARRRSTHNSPLNILVPVTGTRASRQGAEVAIALAQASHGSVTAVYVTTPARPQASWQQRFGTALAPRSAANAAIREVVEFAGHYGVEVKGRVIKVNAAHNAILREMRTGAHDLLVMGVSPRSGSELFFGELAAEILERSECSVLFVSADAVLPNEAAPG
jgi:Kef-type K+ transport system membrane component KefB/nucleotide-binding universal stress UspA family protein